MRKYFFDENCQKDLMEKGYTKVPILSSEELANLRNEINKLEEKGNFSKPGESGINSTLKVTDIDERRNTQNLLHKFFSPHLDKILVNCDLLVLGFANKEPGGEEIVIHQDWSFSYNNSNEIVLTFWCPLVDIDETNGIIHLVEKSHRVLPSIACPQLPQYFQNFPNSLKKLSKPIRVKAGEALFWDSTLIHWSTENNSEHPRIVAVAATIPREAKPVFYFPDKNASNKQLEVFEIYKDFFIDHTIEDLMNGAIQAKSIGFVENTNRTITEEEFMAMFKEGDEIRRKFYNPEDKNKKPKPINFLNKIKELFKK